MPNYNVFIKNTNTIPNMETLHTIESSTLDPWGTGTQQRPELSKCRPGSSMPAESPVMSLGCSVTTGKKCILAGCHGQAKHQKVCQ